MRISVVSNSTPLIELAILDKFDLFFKLFDKIYVTTQVFDEVTITSTEKKGTDELKQSVKNGTIILYKVLENKLIEMMYGKLHKGEISVIVAAKEIGINYVLIDEISARRVAEGFSLIPLGTAGILKLAKLKGYIDELKPLLDKLINNNFRISLKLYNEILKDVNEL